MKKRGQLLTLWMLISILGAVLVAYVFVEIGTQRGSGEIFLKSRVAKEIALEINSLYSIQGDAYIVNNELYGLSFKFKDDSVRVFKGIDGIIGTASYPFVKSGQQELNYEFKKPKQIVLSKINNKIKITKEIPDIFKRTTKGLSLIGKKILIDVMFDDEQSLKIKDIIEIYHNQQPIENLEFDEKEEKDIDGFDVVVSIHSKASDKAVFYVNKKSSELTKNRFLAGVILDSVSGQIEQKEIVELENFDGKKRVLDNNKIAVYIELPETKKTNEIASAIYNSLKD